ncbi:hypothetical protein BDF22DRAFT_685271 [Syncephalis plumigaleata]|nr:hypothetical protein BDF22DRAFT_685271 [Syncephalis plumigaleata]
MNTQDARDILDLDVSSHKSTNNTSVNTTQKRSGLVHHARRNLVNGVNRELFNLIGGLATIPISEQRVHFKEKPNFAAKSSSRWNKKGFTNSARSDDLVLYHWVNEADESTDRSFAGFNKVVDVVEYTNDEYEHIIAHLPSSWSKEETDYLFSLCRQFDLRFLVIADRYNYTARDTMSESTDNATSTHRTLEDIKDRYYTIARHILQSRMSTQHSLSSGLPQDYLDSYVFDKGREALVAEVRRIQLQQRRLQRDHEHVMRLLNIREAPSSGSMNSNAQNASNSNNGAATNTTTQAYNNAGNNNNASSYNTPVSKHKLNAQQQQQQQQKSTPGTDTGGESTKARKHGANATPSDTPTNVTGPDTPLPRRERLTIGVSLRSARLPPIRAQTTANKVITCLRELGVGPRPIMATERVCARYEQLRQSVMKMLERKKYADRMEQELRTLNYRRDELKGESSSKLLAATAATTTTTSHTTSDLDLDDMTTPKLQGRKRSISGAGTLSQKRIRR